jgi:hypothetical protein
VRKAVWLGQGDVEVFFRAGWAIWTGYPLYQIIDHHGWTYHYPPTFALLMGLFANPLQGYPQPWWAASSLVMRFAALRLPGSDSK